MSAPIKLNFKIYQGSTFNEVLRWETSTKVYKQISGITKSAPIEVTTSTAHDIPNGWCAKITNVVGMKEINSDSVYHQITSTGGSTFQINAINAIGYTDYTSGGVVEYNEPVDLAGYTARMQVRGKITDTEVLVTLTTENGGVEIDNVNKTISLLISATDTAAFTFPSGVYSLELVSSTGVVTPFINGTVSLVQEVTR